ncbi:hypothetical protein GBA65_05255 [Rubrobacter marinus]|uniref:DUF5615 domain-containing protein n=1 Tax=Rubrobacter marinus TaxID=2653852 RepID=A0A6G8PUZ9_9ACTN|nr:DUF5615 family PIN-like protein [Rubrobacter marinus]QIN78022.1 hypothetical protein GBA65_05255 [Rubrobacter marinus]
MRFLADENFPSASTGKLREAGHDITDVAADLPGGDYEEVLARAAGEARVVLTFDRDYGELIFRPGLPTPAGVIYLRFEPHHPGEPAERLLELLDAGSLPIEGRFTVLERDRVRQRRLP